MLDLQEPRIVGPGFHERVYAVVRQVPQGRVTTYGDVATLLGSPRVARHVGWALSSLRAGASAEGAAVPWHRVINARGRVSHRGDTFRASEQYLRLAEEGVEFDDSGTLKLAAYRWNGAGCVVPPP
jgi:methylated-DNA-protein-cysteine methyltransferase-like protein